MPYERERAQSIKDSRRRRRRRYGHPAAAKSERICQKTTLPLTVPSLRLENVLLYVKVFSKI